MSTNYCLIYLILGPAIPDFFFHFYKNQKIYFKTTDLLIGFRKICRVINEKKII